ncbi:scavenger receptor cysteine-rich domain superfamily protein-like [Pomacea canaliculata]|uniref:scavenger receptor cysteine-rich domain superfamily protein-like n=1 Tax=Pomacea canaliculata TaxID=400727 RepID=UPI000D734076|nr:scavenger receptor cysteine-rich domain superfamily protein-like [Pomacea canaliculata]
MLYRGAWRTVCVYDFRKQEAQVVCRMLGFNTSQVFAVWTDIHEYGLHFILLPNLNCTGEETSLEHCSHDQFFTDPNCLYDLRITCNTQHTRLRLRDTQDIGPNRGHLQIDIGDGRWETVCVSSNITSTVVCGHLGLQSEIPVESFYGSDRMLGRQIISIFCIGNETSILECQHEMSYKRDCQDYNLICRNSSVNIHSTDSKYPLLEETSATLKCESNNRSGVIKYTWTENAGGFPDGSSLIITRVTREHHGWRVRCEAMYSDGEVVSSDSLQLQVYCEYCGPPAMNVVNKATYSLRTFSLLMQINFIFRMGNYLSLRPFASLGRQGSREIT